VVSVTDPYGRILGFLDRNNDTMLDDLIRVTLFLVHGSNSYTLNDMET
jgi:hypothetical protein